MLDSLKKYIKDGNIFTGVEYIDQQDGISLLCTQLSKKKDELHLLDTFETTSVNELILKTGKKTAFFLSINSSKVISKIISVKATNELELVHNAFPNIDFELFYYEISPFGSQTLVSICRKEDIDTILDTFMSAKAQIVGFSLAFHQVNQVEGFIDEDVIFLSNTVLNKREHSISYDDSTEKEIDYNINGISIRHKFLLSFSDALTQFLNHSKSVSNFKEQNAFYKKEFYEKRFFQLFSKSFATLILLMLLGNFFVFNHYFKKVDQLQQTTQINKGNKEKLIKLNEVVAKKEKLVEDVISSASSSSSLYLSEIASLLPETLRFSEIQYQPILKKVKENEIIQFDTGILEIYGLSKESEDFSKWTEEVEKLDWIAKLDVDDYGYEDNTTSFFKIVIRINNE